jgi:hypothetical protein
VVVSWIFFDPLPVVLTCADDDGLPKADTA